jgi:hypothetical protein
VTLTLTLLRIFRCCQATERLRATAAKTKGLKERSWGQKKKAKNRHVGFGKELVSRERLFLSVRFGF